MEYKKYQPSNDACQNDMAFRSFVYELQWYKQRYFSFIYYFWCVMLVPGFVKRHIMLQKLFRIGLTCVQIDVQSFHAISFLYRCEQPQHPPSYLIPIFILYSYLHINISIVIATIGRKKAVQSRYKIVKPISYRLVMEGAQSLYTASTIISISSHVDPSKNMNRILDSK